MFNLLRIAFWRWWYDSSLNRRFVRPSTRFLAALAFAYFPPHAAMHIPRYIRFMIKMNRIFGLQQAQWELLRQRNALREQGIGPLDTRYPDIGTVLRSWGENSTDNIKKNRREFRRMGYGT